MQTRARSCRSKFTNTLIYIRNHLFIYILNVFHCNVLAEIPFISSIYSTGVPGFKFSPDFPSNPHFGMVPFLSVVPNSSSVSEVTGSMLEIARGIGRVKKAVRTKTIGDLNCSTMISKREEFRLTFFFETAGSHNLFTFVVKATRHNSNIKRHCHC